MNDIHILAGLAPGEGAVVSGLDLSGNIRRRLQDIGLVPGTAVECIQISPLGDPAAYFIRGSVIAIRREDASRILITPCTDGREELWD